MDTTLSILLAGDFIPSENHVKIYSERLQAVLKDKDFSIVNLEAPLTDSIKPIQKNGNNFKINPISIRHIIDGSFDAVSLSNNHIRDFGDVGVTDTLKICRDNNIYTVGAGNNLADAGKPLMVMIKSKRVAFLNFSEREFNTATDRKAGANPFDTISAYHSIQKAKHENDYVIVIYHGGVEYQYYPTPEIVRSFKFMADVGADAIISHHTHRYSGTMIYKGKPLIFGLGNFVSPTKSRVTNEWLSGIIVKIELNNSSIGFKILPVVMSKNFSKVDLQNPDEAKATHEHLDSISNLISDNDWLNDYWEKQDKMEMNRIIRLLKADCRFENRLRKYLPILFKRGISVYKRNNFLNIATCDSHRYRLIRCLEE
jgi:poly-gamma-glutamate synthesis protein (capsule biosynthesis protein)